MDTYGSMMSAGARTGPKFWGGTDRLVGCIASLLEVEGKYHVSSSRGRCLHDLNDSHRSFLSKGDGHTFPRNPKADEMLARLAGDLVSIDKDR